MPLPDSVTHRLPCLALVPLVALVALGFAGCEGNRYSSPTAPLAPPASPTPPSGTPQPSLPPTSEPAAAGVYRRVTTLPVEYLNFHGGTLQEQYVVSADGRFALHFESPRYGAFEYRGSYARGGDLYDFAFDDNPGRWLAQAAFRGTCVVVDYNVDMDLSDFVDGEYCR